MYRYLLTELAARGHITMVAMLCLAGLMASGCGEDEAEPVEEPPEQVAEDNPTDEEPVVAPPSYLGDEAGATHNLWDSGAQSLAIEPWREGRWMVFFSRILTRDDGSERTLFYAYDRNPNGEQAFQGRPFHETAYPVGEMGVQAESERGVMLSWLAGTRERDGRIGAWVRRRGFDRNLSPAGAGRRVYRVGSPLVGTRFRAGGYAAVVEGAQDEELALAFTGTGTLVANRIVEPGGSSEEILISRSAEAVSVDQSPEGSGVLTWIDRAARRVMARPFDSSLRFAENSLVVGAALSSSITGDALVGRPRVGVGPEGRFAVVWGAPPEASHADRYRAVLRVRQFEADGTPLSDGHTVSPEFPVTFDAKYLNTNSGAKLDYRAFDVAVGPGGAVGLAFVSSATGVRPGVRYLALYHSRFGVDGVPAAEPRIVEPIRETNIFVRVAAESDSSSNFAVAWVVGAKVRLRVYTTDSSEGETPEE